jgi:hypothetical protein
MKWHSRTGERTAVSMEMLETGLKFDPLASVDLLSIRNRVDLPFELYPQVAVAWEGQSNNMARISRILRKRALSTQ